jgi:hypothetical protein
MVVLSSNRQLSVRAIHGGSLVVFRVNTGSAHLGKASSTGVRARGVVVGRGVSDTSARERRWGKTVMRAPGGGGSFIDLGVRVQAEKCPDADLQTY